MSNDSKPNVGDLRPNQLLLSFGIGAIIDLPNISAMIMGLDDWPVEHTAEVNEPRLLAAVRTELGRQVECLRSPPIAPESNRFLAKPFDDEAKIGVPVATFPRWVVCPSCRLLSPINSGLFQLKVDRFRRDRTRYIHGNCNKKLGAAPTVVPARFLVACSRGHLDDFPWVEFVHGGATDCRYLLRLYELGATGEAADIEVKCEKCGKTERMARAFGEDGRRRMPRCRGRWPHLRSFAEDGCKEAPVTAILLGASNSWFAIFLSALSVPTATDKLDQLIDENWSVLEKAQSEQNVELLQQVGQLRPFANYTADAIWKALEAKKDGEGQEGGAGELKEPEWEVFSKPDPARNSRNFHLRAVDPPSGYETYLEKVVLVEKLREVRSLVGFTRIESPGDFDPGEFPPEKRAPLSRGHPKWVPASEVRGEGIFLEFSESAIRKWLKRVPALDSEFFSGHRQWRKIRGLEPDTNYPTLRYVLLHSFAHALIRQFSLECGYTTASIRERIYSRGEGDEGPPMAGVLIYTAAPDSEGTLGGLVSLGGPKELGRHLDQAFENVRLCASDPLCAEHRAGRDSLTLHGAACHACLFAPETSCERGNKYLDRSVLVQTVDREDLSFFGQGS